MSSQSLCYNLSSYHNRIEMTMNEITSVYLGLGSNLGDRERNIRNAMEYLSQKAKMIRSSYLYDTAPVGNNNQPRFLNMVCEITTLLGPMELLILAKGIEKEMGRMPGPLNSPRPIDIDILFYGDRIINTPGLIVPHPRLTERVFVLLPLAEIAPELRHPVTGKTVREILDELKYTPDDIKRWEMRTGEK